VRSIRAFLHRVRRLFDNARSERDLADEMEWHLHMAVEDHIRSGMTTVEARRAAMIEAGGIESAKDAYRDRLGFPLLEHILQDVRYTLRTLRKSPGFAITVLLTLALGIGANTAIFSLVDAFLLRLLPVSNPQELILFRGGFSYSTFEQFRDRTRSFSGMFAFDESHVTVTIDGQPDYVDGEFVSGSYYDVLGVHAVVGRTFHTEDDQPGRPAVAVISHRYWDQQFGRERSTVGKTIYLAGIPCTIIGVTPRDFFGTNVAGKSPDVVLPMFLHDALALKDHDAVGVMARLKPGVSLDAAQAELTGLYRQLLSDRPVISPQLARELQTRRIELRTGARGLSSSTGGFAAQLQILTGVVGIALLITCVNIANLLLAKATGRRKEIAVRLSIGASRGRLIRQLLTETAILALIGGCLGLLVAKVGLGILLTVLSHGEGPIPFELHVDLRVLLFTIGMSLIAGVLFGLAPALAAARCEAGQILKGDGHGASRQFHLGSMQLLVVAQVALSLVLLIASGLMIRSLHAMQDVDFGFERDRIVTAWVFPALAGYDRAREMHLYRDLPDRMKAIPGVAASSLLRVRMLRGGWYPDVWGPPSDTASEQSRKARCDLVGPAFFETMGISLLRGRDFSTSDSESAPKVAVISESMARTFFPGQNPIGLHLGFDGPGSSRDVEVVGMVRDVRHRVPEDRPIETVYIPYTQAPPGHLGQINVMVRTAAGTAATVSAMRRELQSIDPNLPLVGAQTQADEIDDAFGRHRSLATLLSIFGGMTLMLAAIGLYGTMSHAVVRRTKELGIRTALGAQKRDIRLMVMGQALLLVLIGVAVGIPMAAGGTRFIAAMLFGVKTTDPVTIAVAVAAMFTTTVLATWIPCARAMRIDPIIALRYE
jgi:predicted permease